MQSIVVCILFFQFVSTDYLLLGQLNFTIKHAEEVLKGSLESFFFLLSF